MDIIGAYASSHTGLIYARSQAPPAAQREAIYAAFRKVRDAIARERPDAIVIVATDHQQAFPLTGVPMFAVGVGPEATGLGDGGIPRRTVSVHQPLAQAVLEGCVNRGIDLLFCEQVRIDHSFMCPLTFITPEFDIPIVPIVQNCNVPPLPTMRRSHEVGRAIRESILEGASGRAVVIGTGGLSHWVGSKDRIEFMKRPAGTRWATIDQHPVEIAESGPVNETFDRAFLGELQRGHATSFMEKWTSDQLENEAGNGAHEVRNWILAAAMAADACLEVISYEPIREWLTGIAVGQFRIA